MKPLRYIIPALAGVAMLQTASTANAVDIDGLWASNSAVCGKIFVSENKHVSLARDSDAYGSGFIIEGDEIRGKLATCNIKARKEEGTTVHLIAVCSTDVSLSTTQFSFRLDDRNAMTRIFPSMPDMVMTYVRCPAP